MKKDEPKFEQIMSDLEGIVTELDSSLGLEDSLKKFERGMALAKQAEERLKIIENEFKKIQQQFTTLPEVDAKEMPPPIEENPPSDG